MQSDTTKPYTGSTTLHKQPSQPPTHKKSVSAADRTVDLFTGMTNVEAGEQTDIEDNRSNVAESYTDYTNRLRTKAFEYQETLSKHFGTCESGGQYRLTVDGDWLFLERFGVANGQPYSWRGFMFPANELYEMTSCLVKAYRTNKVSEAARARKEKENGSG